MTTPSLIPFKQPARKSGLLFLRDEVARFFEEQAIPATVGLVGAKYRSFTANQSEPRGAGRVVFIPGAFDPDNPNKRRDYGRFTGPRQHESVWNPRELWCWEKIVTISIWSAPVLGESYDEQKSTGIVEDLLEVTMQAIRFTQGADYVPDTLTIAPLSDGGYGVELLTAGLIKGPIFDVTYPTAAPSTSLQKPTS
jgi:hypothetical protein